jgi:hypothetical protein
MQSFTIHTLIDVTETRVFKHQLGSELAKLQQQNFMTLLQTIGLRANPAFTQGPNVEELDLKDLFFGSAYRGPHRVWTFKFDIEYDGAFVDEVGNEVGLLSSNMHYVPIITDLTETIDLRLAVFDTSSSDFRNTVVYTGV